MRAIDYLRLLSLAAIWGASFLFMRIASPAIGPINTAFFRVFFGLIGLAIIIAIIRKSLAFRGKLGKILILGAINSGIPFLMYSIAATLLPAGYSAILNATTPLTGAMIGFFIFSERLTIKKWLGVTLGIIGITVITTVGDSNIVGNIYIGVAACIIATIGYGFAGFLTRKWITQQGGLDSTLVAFGSQIGATAFLSPFYFGTSHLAPALIGFKLMCGSACSQSAFYAPPSLISFILDWSLTLGRYGRSPLHSWCRPSLYYGAF
ncbi:hypothetical protein HORIV_44570 [Vreelandella olivaria]|uniref:EamA domain-containing protein n=1 Tax=Vreelandella olivaria TaxID=390919 RepID=A0ABN5X5G5_9GAMM|nr:hypothetical protein HORIV_44570 [Halomonas olivaria]